MRSPAMTDPLPDERPGIARRALMIAFLVVFLVTGAADVEAWPLSGWKLFSRVRTGDTAGWSAVMVDHAGHEQRVPFGALPRGFHGAHHLLPEFGTAHPPTEVCRAWGQALRHESYDVAAIRIYFTRNHRRRVVDACPAPA